MNPSIRQHFQGGAAARALRAMAGGCVALVLAGTPAGAEIHCGSTILPGERVQLDRNIGPCSAETGGILVLGPATLDLNGHSVTCLVSADPQDVPVGIRLAGERARLKNGSVLACLDGVTLTSAGKHKVTSVTAAFNHKDGFGLYSDRNVLKHNEALSNGHRGISVYERRNTVKRNRVEDNGWDGIYLRGSEHKVIRNEIRSHSGSGIGVSDYGFLPGGPSKILRNVVSGSGIADLYAESGICSDVWRANTHQSASPSCLQ